ncbi:hypothetical protein EDC96DRAFT_610469 [Choanephora cucurbitarum]|nr:hypothetical protein EDC96DRAFT_610469 [Choanephora cucurbitarum]
MTTAHTEGFRKQQLDPSLYVAVAYQLYGDKEQSAKAKGAILSVTLEELKNDMSYEDSYRSSFGMITDEVKTIITCGIDLHKKEYKSTHYGRHKRWKAAGKSF